LNSEPLYRLFPSLERFRQDFLLRMASYSLKKRQQQLSSLPWGDQKFHG